MTWNARLTLAITRFFRKYKKVIIIAIICWLVVIMINNYLKNLPKTQNLINTLSIDTPVMDDGDKVPNRYRDVIKKAIDAFIKSCNAKDYEKAYQLVNDDCKEYTFDNQIDNFKEYVDNIFTSQKIYNIQNYSNFENLYIYSINIIDNVGATGSSGTYKPYSEKFTMHKQDDGSFKISLQGYVENKKINKSSEDTSMKVEVKSKDISYSREQYNLVITNKTDKYMVIADNKVNSEVVLLVNAENRSAINIANGRLVLKPGETREVSLIFDKYFDDKSNPEKISFNTVRLLENYESGQDTTTATEKFSYNIEFIGLQ